MSQNWHIGSSESIYDAQEIFLSWSWGPLRRRRRLR